jgi:hypothetical protein
LQDGRLNLGLSGQKNSARVDSAAGPKGVTGKPRQCRYRSGSRCGHRTLRRWHMTDSRCHNPRRFQRHSVSHHYNSALGIPRHCKPGWYNLPPPRSRPHPCSLHRRSHRSQRRFLCHFEPHRCRSELGRRLRCKPSSGNHRPNHTQSHWHRAHSRFRNQRRSRFHF